MCQVRRWTASDSARWALAIQELRRRPQDYGINAARLDEDAFRQRASEREKALEPSVTEAYRYLWFYSASGQIERHEIHTAGGESGVSVIERIRKVLLDDKEMVTRDDTDQASLQSLQALFFSDTETPSLDEIRNHFLCRRSWPVLETMSVFGHIIRSGVQRDVWCLFRMGGPETTSPAEFFDREQDLPLDLDLSLPGWSIIRPEDAKKRKWIAKPAPDLHLLGAWITDQVETRGVVTYAELRKGIQNQHGDVKDQDLSDALSRMIHDKSLSSYKGTPNQKDRPELIQGSKSVFYTPSDDDVVITNAEAAKRDWLDERSSAFTLRDREGARALVPLLGKIGSLYNRGATSRIDEMDISGLELPDGGTLRLSVNNAPPKSVKKLGELFEVLAGVTEMGKQTLGDLEIRSPDDDCIFIRAIEEGENEAPREE